MAVFLIFTACLPVQAAKNKGYKFPVPQLTRISQYYSSSHKAIDIAANMGTNVYAAKSGTIIKKFTGCNNYSRGNGKCRYGGVCKPSYNFSSKDYCNDGFGNGYVIKHDDGTWAEYAHMNYLPDSIKVNSYVTQGTYLGGVSSTGNSAGPHLHFGIRTGGNTYYDFWHVATPLNPLDYMDTDDGGSGNNTQNNVSSNTYTAYVKGTDGSLAINIGPRVGGMVGKIPEGASCTVYPNRASGNWLWVTYNGVSGYSYKNYLSPTPPVYTSPSTPVPASSNTYTAYVKGTDGSLVINSKPAKGNQIGLIPEGASCTVNPNRASGNWLWVTYNGVSGYSYKTYLTTSTPVSPQVVSNTRTGVVRGTDGTLVINSKPAKGNQIGLIPEGASCTVYPDKKSGNWYWVSYGGVSGYSYSKYIILQ